MTFSSGVAIVVVALALYAVFLYNKLVRLKNTVGSSWADVDVLLKKRYNLVDNLVETVKSYAKHEKGVFIGVGSKNKSHGGVVAQRKIEDGKRLQGNA